MTTVKQIFNYIQSANPSTTTFSSMGSLVTNQAQQVADSTVREIMNNVPESSLAYKIATSLADRFSDKQLWVMAYELDKNEEFKNKVVDFYAQLDRKAQAKQEESKAKLKANKEASADVLQPIKKAKKLGDFGKWLNTKGNKFRKQHFSKKYTKEAVNEFLQTI